MFKIKASIEKMKMEKEKQVVAAAVQNEDASARGRQAATSGLWTQNGHRLCPVCIHSIG